MLSLPTTTRRLLSFVVFPLIIATVFAFTFVFWNTEKRQALSQLAERTHLEAIALRAEIEGKYGSIAAALDRLAIQPPPDSPRRTSQWESDVDFYLSSFDGLTRIFWVDSSYTIQRFSPSDGSGLKVGDSAQLLETSLEMPLLVRAARYDGEFVGFIFAQIDLPSLLTTTAQETGDTYSVSVERGSDLILEHGETAASGRGGMSSSVSVDLSDAGGLTLTIAPTTSTVRGALADARSTLLIGLVIAAVMMAVFIIAQLVGRLLIQERLRRQWEVLESVLNGIPQGVYVIDPSTFEVLFANEQIGQLAKADLTGDMCFRGLWGLDAPCSFCTSSSLPNNGDPYTWEHRDDRSGKDFLITDRLIDWVSGRRVRLSIATDITLMRDAERKRRAVEGQLRQSQKLESIGTLASGIAHEINNPLMGVINYAELLKDKARDEEDHGFIEGIIREGNRVATIVRNLLSFARQDKETHSPALIGDIVEQALSLTAAVLRRDGITVDVAIPDDLPALRCRSQQIEQVIINLVANARDALNERYSGYDDGKLLKIAAEIVTKEGARWIDTTIEDRGTGIPTEQVERIFDPFFTTKPRDEGTGLGLSVSYGIVKEHQGNLWVESEVGEYTRFHVELRLEDG